ncbi:MAG: YfhO family protein [Bacteroidia bacterium]|nr:YfhO family protein [Bacteroidia bacterium]
MNKKKSQLSVDKGMDVYPVFIEKLHPYWNWISLIIITIVGILIFSDFVFQEKLFLFKDIGSDTLNGVWPYHYLYAKYLHEIGMPRWSFQEGMGQSIFSGWLRDPFELIAYLIGPSSIPRIFIYIELLKIVLAGWVFYFFLRMWKLSPLVATIGALMFAYSGFMIIGACWYLFTYEGLMMALLLYGFEKIYQEKQGWWFFLGIAGIGVSMPFDLYLFGIFLLSYILFRLWLDNAFQWNIIRPIFLQLILFGAAGILITGPFFLETLNQLFNSPRGSSENSPVSYFSSQPMFRLIDKLQFGTFVMRQFSSDLMGTGSQFSGWFNFLEAPVSYSSILSLILFPLSFAYFNKHERKVFFVFLAIWFFTLIFPYFRTLVWAFTGEYYRGYSMFFVIIFVLYACIAFERIIKSGHISVIALIGIVLILLGFLHYDYFKNTRNFAGGIPQIDSSVSTMVHFYLIGYTILLITLNVTKKSWVVLSIAGLLIIELVTLNRLSVTRRDVMYVKELNEKVSYNDYSVDAVKWIKQHEKDLFYRIDKVGYYSSGAIHGSLNDNRIQGYYTTSNYNSFAQLNYVRYFKTMGIISKNNEVEARWVPGLAGRPLLEAQNQVKYILLKAPIPPQWKLMYDSLTMQGDVKILKHKYALPFGFTYNKVMKLSDFEKIHPSKREIVTSQTAVLDDTTFFRLSRELKSYSLADTNIANNFTFDVLGKFVDTLSAEHLNLNYFSENLIKGRIKVSDNKILYLSIPYDTGWHIKLNGQKVTGFRVNGGMTGIYLPKGEYQVELEFHLPYASKGIVMSALGLLLIIGIAFFKEKMNIFLYGNK